MGFLTLTYQNQSVRFSGEDLCFHFIPKGHATCKRNGHTHPLFEDVFLLQNIGTPHTVIAAESPVISLCLPQALIQKERFAECATPHDHHVHQALAEILDQTNPRAEPLFRALIRARDHSKERYYLAPSSTPLMIAAREFFLQHLANPLGVPAAAHHCGLSPFHFHRLFSQTHQTTPGQYVRTERIRRACRKLVLTRAAIATIAQECGFQSPTQFAGSFRNVTGFTPTDFRHFTERHRPQLIPFLS